MQAVSVTANTSINEVCRIEAPNLGLLNRGTGTTANSEAVIAGMIMNLIEYMGFSWSAMQVEECAALWSKEYYWMTSAECVHFISKAKSGQWSKTDFRHLAPQILLSWLDDYSNQLLQERRRIFEEKNDRESIAFKKTEEPEGTINVDMTKLLEGLNLPLIPKKEDPKEDTRDFETKKRDAVWAASKAYGLPDNIEPLNHSEIEPI